MILVLIKCLIYTFSLERIHEQHFIGLVMVCLNPWKVPQNNIELGSVVTSKFLKYSRFNHMMTYYIGFYMVSITIIFLPIISQLREKITHPGEFLVTYTTISQCLENVIFLFFRKIIHKINVTVSGFQCLVLLN